MKRLFPTLPETPDLGDVFRTFPATLAPILELNDKVLLADSALSTADRELIAAYVSGLNACTYCLGSHTRAAEAFGVDPALIDALIADPTKAPVEDRLKPILAYVACLTQTPAMVTEAMAQAVFDAGWSEQALYDAILVCAMFSFMNRIVEGTGVTADFTNLPAMTEDEKAARRTRTYSDWGRSAGLI